MSLSTDQNLVKRVFFLEDLIARFWDAHCAAAAGSPVEQAQYRKLVLKLVDEARWIRQMRPDAGKH